MFPRGRYCNTPYLKVRAKAIDPKSVGFLSPATSAIRDLRRARLALDGPSKGLWCLLRLKCPVVPITGDHNVSYSPPRTVLVSVEMNLEAPEMVPNQFLGVSFTASITDRDEQDGTSSLPVFLCL